MTNVHAACTTVNWPNDSQKYDPLADKKNILFELALVLPLYAIIFVTYAGMHNNYGKFLDEKVGLQTSKWWKVLF